MIASDLSAAASCCARHSCGLISEIDGVVLTVSANAVQRFYCDNFIDLMGAGLAEDLRHPAHLVAA